MAYQSPTIAPSGTTFSQLKAGGLHGQLIRLANANAFSPTVRSLVLGPVEALKTGAVHAVDGYLHGDPVSTGNLSAKLLAYATALKALSTALDEVNSLVDSNPGIVKVFTGVGASGQVKRRTFP